LQVLSGNLQWWSARWHIVFERGSVTGAGQNDWQRGTAGGKDNNY
jgi:hypothetical protein